MTSTAFRLGYGGSAVIDGIQVLITGGGMEETDSPSVIEAMDIPPPSSDSSTRSKILHADGTAAFSANINFDCTKNSLPLLSVSRLLRRGYSFGVGINDGENSYETSDCLVTTLSVSGAPGGLIGVALGVDAKSGKIASLISNNYLLNYSSSVDDQPMGYWWSGNEDVRDWTFTMNQAVEPMYLNENTTGARYLKTGLVEYVLDVTTYAPHDHNKIIIATDVFTLTGVTTARGYSFGGVSDLGTYSHSFTTAASAVSGSNGLIIN
jgi:hypothetical protein